MLDYEILGYKVEYVEKGASCVFVRRFDTEEKATEFIKNNRKNWVEYALIKKQAAIIDF